MKRLTLVLMQLAGAVTLLGYPFVMVASVMALAAPAEAGTGAWATVMRGVFAATLVYPLAWAALWVSSWVTLKRGRSTLAFLLSTPPLLALIAFTGLIVFNAAYVSDMQRGYAANQAKEAERVGGQNPLLAAAMRFETSQMSWPSFEAAIRSADARQLSTAVRLQSVEIPGVIVTRMPDAPPEPVVMRTPLGYTLERSHLGPDYDLTHARPHFVDAARLMIERGAILAPEEIAHHPQLERMLDAVRLPPR